MKKVGSLTKKLKAFSLVEILLTVTIFTITVMTIVSFMTSSGDSIKNSTQYNEANYYLTQGLEALKNIKDSSYSSLNVGTYGLTEVASVWQLTGTSDNTNGYIRKVMITAPDASTKLATTEVSWINNQNQTQVITASLTFKDWNRAGYSPTPTPPLTDWNTPVYLGFDNLSMTYTILDMFKQGDFIYGIRSNTSVNFFIVDVSNPECPITIFDGTIPTLTYAFTSIAVKDTTVYLTSATNTAEILLINVTNKTAPTVLTLIDLTGNDNGQTVRVYGNRMYVGRVGAGTNPSLYIYNVTTANSPILLGSWNPGVAFTVNDLYVKGSYAYLATTSTTGEIRVVNLTNEALPTSSTIYDLPANGSATSINGYGNKLLVSNAAFLIYAFDISVATTLTLQDATPYSAGALVNEIVFNATGTLAFTATSNATSEFQILNTSNLTNITLYSSVNITAGTFIYNSVIYDAVTDTNYLGGSYTLEEFAVYRTGPYTPTAWCSTTILASKDLTGTTGEVMDMVKQGNYIIGIRLGITNNFFIIDVTNPAVPGTPVNLSIALATGNTLTSIAVKDNVAYVTTTVNTSEMVMVNITNKSAPVLIASPTFDLAGNDDGKVVRVYGNRLYLARSSSQTNPMFYIYNITTATNPTLVGSLTLPTAGTFVTNDLYVNGYYAYISSTRPTAEITVVNISNEIVPVASTTYDLPPIGTATTSYTISGSGNKLLVGDSTNLWYAFDISTPTTLVLKDPTPFNAVGIIYDVAFDTTGNIAFIGTGNASLEFQILNVADLTNITTIGSYNLVAGGFRYRTIVYDPVANIIYAGGNLTTQEFVVFHPGPQ